MSESMATVMQDPDLDESAPTRAVAAEARELRENPAFILAGANLTKLYMKKFCELSPVLPNGSPNPHFETQCARANLMLNVIGDVLGHLTQMADHHKVDDAAAKRLVQSGAN